MASPQTMQPATADTYINEAAATTNYGTAADFRIQKGTGSNQFSLLKFDFSSVVPAGATITLATLSLYAYTANGPDTLTAYRLLRTDWSESQATWNEYKTGSSWGTAGALNTTTDFTTDDSASGSVANNSAAWHNFTVTAQVQTARDSVSGVAHFKIIDTADYYYQRYRSSNYTTDTSLRPKLYIEYTLPPAIQTVNGLAKASVKTINALVIASVKTINGLA